MMKKMMFTLLLALACQLSFGQTAESVFDAFKTEKKAEFLNFPRVIIGLAAGNVKDERTQVLLKEVKSVKVLSLEECGKATRRKFAKEVTALAACGYESYGEVSKGKEKITVLVKPGTGDLISEIVTLVADEDECVGVLVTGSIRPDDVAAVAGMVGDGDFGD